MRRVSALLAALLALALAGCATLPTGAPGAVAPRELGGQAVLRSLAIDPALEERILALDPDRITDVDVRTVLAAGPTPRIISLHGGIYPVHLVMSSFANFLVGMGYPEAKISHPGDGRLSHSPYEPSSRIAGAIAWYYEREAMMPMMIGHSQGGIQAVKVLYELAGDGGGSVRVWDPLTDSAEERETIVDPLSGRTRPVVGLRVGYVSVVGAGGAALLLPNQWSMVGRLRTVPDSVETFTGYALAVDFFAWDFSGSASDFRASGTAKVRNVRLPADYSHVTVAATEHLARESAMRDWLNAYQPGGMNGEPVAQGSTANVLWAADVWFHIKRQWTLEAQTLVRARRSLRGEPRRRRVRRAISISLGCGDSSRPLVCRNLEEVDCDVRGRSGV